MSPHPLTLAHAFRRCRRLFAEKMVVSATAIGLERISYGSWADRTCRLARSLERLSLSADARVASFASNSSRHLELYFAVPGTGRVLHTLNIRLFADQVVFIVNHAEDEAVFVDRSLLPALWPLVGSMPSVRHVVVMDDGSAEALPADSRLVTYDDLVSGAEPVDLEEALVPEERAAMMCYTSGTTGLPKGVLYSHRSIMLHALGIMSADSLAVSESDVILPVVPMFHANAWGLPHAAVMTGASLVLPGADLSPRAITTLMERENVTLAAGVPTIWNAVLDELPQRDHSALSRIMSGGAPLPRALSDAYCARIGLPLTQSWGMTEISPVGAVWRLKSTLTDETGEAPHERLLAVGQLGPLLDYRIVEPVSESELPWDGVTPGELQVRGPFVAAGYYRGDGSSGYSFAPGGWLRTGDVATIDEHGYVRIVDRTKDLVKSGGEWISSVQLESEIMAHPGVREAAVVGVADDKWGERPLALVVTREGAKVTAEELRSFLRERVAKWWIPEDIRFIDEIPKTSVGKFNKAELRERYRAP
jgi:fatty-acyl-CoA synthase